MAYLLGIVYGGNRVCEGYYKPNTKKQKKITVSLFK